MGWYALLDILKEARTEVAAQQGARPVACPDCGEPLREGPTGQLFCLFDGWLEP